jgi:endonuclease-3
LSAQCTDKKVNEVTPSLFKKYPNFTQLAAAKLGAIEEIIRPVNYYKTKSRNLKALGIAVSKKYSSKLPTTHAELIELPGVGRKTANVVLSEQGKTPALPVDTHVLRLSNRLGFSKKQTPEGVEQDLMKIFPPESWRELHHRLIFHGRRVCKARSPLCMECKLNKICPSAYK